MLIFGGTALAQPLKSRGTLNTHEPPFLLLTVAVPKANERQVGELELLWSSVMTVNACFESNDNDIQVLGAYK